MKIHLENVNLNSSTGPNSFANRLVKELKNLGHSVVDEYQGSDVTCVFIESYRSFPKEHPVVQRLDGIWFKPEEFSNKNTYIKRLYESSDQIIWQSDFDKKMTTSHWGSRPGSVIHNGIEISVPSFKNEQIKSLRRSYDKLFVCSANWHPQKRLSKNIEFFQRYKVSKKEKCALIVMGSSPDSIVKDDDIFYTGSIPHNLCLEIFAASDWMIHLAWLDHCPNTVVESLSQKCPVICTNSGGTSEIVKSSGIVISESTPYNFELADYDNPYDLDLSKFDFETLGKKIEVDNSHLDISLVAKRYEEVFLRAVEIKN